MGLSGRSMGHNERRYPPRSGSGRCIARPLNLRRKSSHLLYTCYRIQTISAIQRTRFLLRTGSQRRKRFRWKDRDCPYLWFLRSDAGSTLSFTKSRDFSDMRILRALATAGLIGNIVKFNASISGAEVGCQGEVGVACAMASAAANQLFGVKSGTD